MDNNELKMDVNVSADSDFNDVQENKMKENMVDEPIVENDIKVENTTQEDAQTNENEEIFEAVDDEISVEDFCAALDKISEGLKEDDSNHEEINDQLLAVLRSVIIRPYVPVLQKREIIETLFNSCLVDDNGNYYVDSFLYEFNLRMVPVVAYTSLEVVRDDEEDESRVFEVYDMLNSRGVIDALIDLIPEAEIAEISRIADSMTKSFENQHKTVEAVVFRTMSKIGEGLSDAAEILVDYISSQPEMKDSLSKLADLAGEALTEITNKENAESEDVDVTDEAVKVANNMASSSVVEPKDYDIVENDTNE